jgi:putative ABC transport system permease protein
MPVADALRQDVKSALRGLWKSPGFAVAALVTLALGIGATSAIFSVVNAVLLTPLPYASPAQRVMVWSKWVSFDKTWVSNAELLDYQRMSQTLTDVAAWTTAQQNLTGDGEPVRVGVMPAHR